MIAGRGDDRREVQDDPEVDAISQHPVGQFPRGRLRALRRQPGASRVASRTFHQTILGCRGTCDPRAILPFWRREVEQTESSPSSADRALRA